MHEPMQDARQYAELSERKAQLELELKSVKDEMKEIEPRLLAAIEEERYPSKSTVNGRTLFVRRQLWASPKDGDYERACQALREAGLGEYVQTRFNVQSISAYVRDLDSEGVTLDPRVADALKITEKFELRAQAS